MGIRTIRKGVRNIRNKELFLNGKLLSYKKAAMYCKLHKCYLEPNDIKNRKCNYKNCLHRKELI